MLFDPYKSISDINVRSTRGRKTRGTFVRDQRVRKIPRTKVKLVPTHVGNGITFNRVRVAA